MQLFYQIFHEIQNNASHPAAEELGIQTRFYPKGSMLLIQGEKDDFVRVLLHGRAHAVRYTYEGREIDFFHLKNGSVFGEGPMIASGIFHSVSVFADSDCTVMLFSYSKLIGSVLPDAHGILKIFTQELSEKCFLLQQRIYYVTQPTLRGKIMAYLSDCRVEYCSDSFYIPMDRSELAAFLCCDRSSLCRALSSLKADGIVTYRKNHFRFL